MRLFEKCYNFTDARALKNAGCYPYFKSVESGLDAEVTIDGKKVIMLGSNNYLGLANHPKVKEAAKKAVDRYGVGCTGSRLLTGTLDIHIKLERKLAEFLNKEDALVFSTGFQTNLGTISSLVTRHDILLIDKEDHASILDGCRLSYGKIFKFKHNDVKHLGSLLANFPEDMGKLIVVDGIYSVSGDIVNLPDIMKVCEKYKANLMLDEAHSLGVFGKGGRGTGEYFGLEEKLDIVMGTFSKSFGSIGGFIVAKEPIIDFVKHHSRPFIFSASMPPPSVAAVLAALEIVEKEPERRDKFWTNTNLIKKGLYEIGFKVSMNKSSIVALFIGEESLTFTFWQSLFDEGVFTNPIITPAVPKNGAILRISCMATHNEKSLIRVLEIFERVGKRLKII
ncbi:MAG: aminotransferase class I/II-fold pyridoxal phosphate-dependent enzyme [Thermodesulfobacteriota bacterium]|nr:aminotransferase class I/II-fold pyridoxal phosphate-dependent enzyme [Thermodesulfobacteriota bacterium]